ncbi:cytochrome b5 domain-containing protein RLF-like isoform X2 [Phragmites australis]|uniref:cytochrome b5 domain-containing protein RLF-like isoform X2 n=1 Tax=Phragmites australis TaxID=29695 RepID=UPI002D78586B|nr:cytochrome b5 domain-containing protein RLF-like isoform X2 [Phragmites australis]
MADEGSSDFTFCKVSSAENDGQLGSPKGIPVASMTLEDVRGDSASISKKRELQTNDSDKDGRSNSISGSIVSVSLQDCNVKEPVIQTSKGAESNVTQPKPSLKKPPARAKVPFEKGYSQMDWLKLTRTHPDLAGLKGQSNRRLISLEEVKQHKTGDCIWTVLKGRVYNIAPYMKFHPGGVDMLMKASGKDCTALFNKYHAWVNAEFLLEKCLVGFLDPNE